MTDTTEGRRLLEAQRAATEARWKCERGETAGHLGELLAAETRAIELLEAWTDEHLEALLSAAEQVAGMREENERLREELEERKRLPEDVIERLIALGPVEWGASAAQSDDAHCAGLAETLAVTRKDFGLEGDRQMHGVFLKGTGIIVCQTGTSPNSGKHAAIIDGALNMLHRLALEHRSALTAERARADGLARERNAERTRADEWRDKHAHLDRSRESEVASLYKTIATAEASLAAERETLKAARTMLDATGASLAAAVKEREAMREAAIMLLSNDGAGMGDYHSGRALMGRWALAILAGHRVIEQAPAVLHDEIRSTLATLTAEQASACRNGEAR